ncbi:MAG: YraN family protein [Planctomycetia bacterium]|nr:YraN family protein [Planctomycetia bacterium]
MGWKFFVKLMKNLFASASAEGKPPEIPAELIASRENLGHRGEGIARWFLETHEKMTFVAANAIVRESAKSARVGGEIDLIMVAPGNKETIVFVEVRTRTERSLWWSPFSSVTRLKRLRVCRAARTWLRENNVPLSRPVRFDVVAIVWEEGKKPDIRHYPSAFGWTEPKIQTIK